MSTLFPVFLVAFRDSNYWIADMPYTGAKLEENRTLLAELTPQQVWEMHLIEKEAFARFKGQIDEFEAAVGMFHLGHHVGWKPLVLIHNKRTLKKYEDILGIKVREYFKEEGPSADRSIGYKIVKKLGNFWKAVSGEVKDEGLKTQRRELD